VSWASLYCLVSFSEQGRRLLFSTRRLVQLNLSKFRGSHGGASLLRTGVSRNLKEISTLPTRPYLARMASTGCIPAAIPFARWYKRHSACSQTSLRLPDLRFNKSSCQVPQVQCSSFTPNYRTLSPRAHLVSELPAYFYRCPFAVTRQIRRTRSNPGRPDPPNHH
jgi:hypothetical protein